MKFTLSALPTAMMTVALMSGPIVTYASTGSDNIELSDDMTPVTVTKIVDADGQINNQTAQTAMAPSHTLAETHAEHSALNTLIDPITHKAVDNSYPLEVSSFLSLEQAQKLLVQVSPKIAANQAAIAASEYQTEALRTIDNPLVFARVSASAYHLDEDIDLSSLRNGIVNGVNNTVDNAVPPIADLPDLPNFGELVGERIPDSYNIKRSGSTTGAGLGVVWPIYTAGRTDALTGASDARTQEAVADSILDKNELYNTLIERYFKAQLAIIAAYLREDAYDTLQQTDHMAERLFEEGFISRVDRLEAQSALADAKSESVNANCYVLIIVLSRRRHYLSLAVPYRMLAIFRI